MSVTRFGDGPDPAPTATFAQAVRSSCRVRAMGSAGMRETVLVSSEGRKATITTGDQGTEVLDADGRVVGSYGSDRHEELLEKHQEEGWRIAKDGDVAPAQVADAPPPSDDDGTGDGFRELDLGNTG